MQAVSFPSSPTPPAGAAASPQPKSARRDDGGGFGQVLRGLSDQPTGPTPEPVAPDGLLADSARPDASAAGAEAEGNLLTPDLLPDLVPDLPPDLLQDLPPDLPSDLQTSDALNETEAAEAETPPATDLLVLLVTGAAVAARLPPAAFAITQAAEGAMTLLASDGPVAGSAVAAAGPEPMGLSGPPLSPPDAAGASRMPTLPQGPLPAAGDMRDPDMPPLSAQTGPSLHPMAEAPVMARISLSDPDVAAAFVQRQAGAVPAAFAFRSTELSEASGIDGPAADLVGTAPAPSASVPGTAIPAPDPAAGTVPLADLPEIVPPPILQGDGDIQFAAPSSLTQAASAPALHGVGASFVPAPLAATLSDLLLRRTDGPVELTLSPEELGRVRLSLSPDGDGLHVTVQVERGDTLDLLRRNSDLLLQEIRAQGFSGATFSFSGWAGDRPEPRSPSGTGTGPLALPSDPAGFAPPLAPSSASGLDLRL